MKDMNPEINHLTDQIIGAAIEVHRTLGPGFLESTYEKALSIELNLRNVAHVCEAPVSLTYKNRPVGEGRLDMLVSGQVIVELKAIDKLAPIHHAQVISYLKATGHPIGLLINFNAEVLKDGLKRIVLSSANSAPPRFNPDA